MTPLRALLSRQTFAVPDNLAALVWESLEAWRIDGTVRRLWARDATLWTGTDEGEWLGWLGITEDQQATCLRLRTIAEEVRCAGFSHALLLGMGGLQPLSRGGGQDVRQTERLP